MQKMKKVCILAFILVSICMNDLAVLAAEKTDEVLLLNQLKVENNGGESLIQKESNKEAHFTYDTAGLEEGYYTSFLYVEAEQSLSDVLGFSFEISTENALYLNLNLLANETTLVMPDQTNVYMLPEGSTKILCQVVENGTVTYTFYLQNSGNTATAAADYVIVTDTFDPILSGLAVTLDGAPLTLGTDYTYDTATGAFATTAGTITVPAATAVQDAETGLWRITPGVTKLVITGTV